MENSILILTCTLGSLSHFLTHLQDTGQEPGEDAISTGSEWEEREAALQYISS